MTHFVHSLHSDVYMYIITSTVFTTASENWVFCGGSFCFMSWCLKFFCAVGALCVFS